MTTYYYHIFVIISTIFAYIILKKTYKGENNFKSNFLITLYTPVILYMSYYLINYLNKDIPDISEMYQSSVSV
jgi:hypothetical protein